MIEQKIQLDLRKQNLYGWEGRKSKFAVYAYANRLLEGDKFPPVPIYRINDGTYQLTKLLKPDNSGMDGGHRRSIAHLIVGKMLDCIVKGEKEEVDMRYHKPILIRDIQLTIGDEAIRDYRLLQHQDKRYRV